MKTQEKCNRCGFEGMMKFGIKFFTNKKITEMAAQDKSLPKFGFHYGSWCPKCGVWRKWETQTDKLCDKHFWEEV